LEGKPKLIDSTAAELARYPDDEMQIRALFLRGFSQNLQGRPDSAEGYFSKALEIMPVGTALDQRLTWFTLKRNLAIAQVRSNKEQAAGASFGDLYRAAKKKGDSLLIGSAAKSLATFYNHQASYDSAIFYFQKALKIYQEKSPEKVTSTLLGMGTIYGRIKQTGKSLIWFRQARAKALASGEVRLAMRAANNLGVAYRELNQLDSSRYYLRLSLKEARNLASRIDELQGLGNLTRLSLLMQQTDSAADYLHEAYEVARKGMLPPSYSLANLYGLSAELALEQGNAPDEALAYLDSIEKMKPPNLRKDLRFLKLKATALEQLGAADSALKLWRQYDLLRDSLEQLKDAKKIEEVAAAYQVEEERRARLGLSASLKRNQKWIYFLGGFLILSLLLVFLNRRRLRLLRKKEEQHLEKIGQISEELLQLKAEVAEQIDKKDSQQSLKFKSGAVVAVDELIFIETEGHYLNIHLEGNVAPEVERQSMVQLLELLPPDQFARVHRRFALNLKKVRSVKAAQILLKNGAEIPLSRTYRKEVLQKFETI
jgi:tetratricopeptide (TPR) repeat protein